MGEEHARGDGHYAQSPRLIMSCRESCHAGEKWNEAAFRGIELSHTCATLAEHSQATLLWRNGSTFLPIRDRDAL